MSHNIQIFLANARLDDPAAMATLLAPLQDGGAIGRALVPGQTAYAFVYNIEGRSARYLVCDGELVSCFTLAGVTREEGTAISKACDGKTDWSLDSFQATVAKVLGGSFETYN